MWFLPSRNSWSGEGSKITRDIDVTEVKILGLKGIVESTSAQRRNRQNNVTELRQSRRSQSMPFSQYSTALFWLLSAQQWPRAVCQDVIC